MDRQILNFTANEQILTVSNPIRISTNKVNYIEAHFALGDNWSGYDSVRAVWFNDYQTISTVLNSDGVCRVPFEVLKRKGKVKVDLVGSISDGDVLTDRLTSYPVIAVIVDCISPITGAETSPITPSQFEQFVSTVRSDADRAEAGASSAEASSTAAGVSESNASVSAQSASESAQTAQSASASAQADAQSAENAKDDAEVARDEILGMRAEAETLPAGSSATASYSDGVLSLGIPKGDTGATGPQGPQGIQGEAGPQGPKGDTGEVSQAEFDEAITDLKSDISEFDVLKVWHEYGDEVVTTNSRYAYYSSSSIGTVSYAGGDAYEIDLHGNESIKLTGYYETSTKFIYQLGNGTYGTKDDLTTKMYRDEVIELPSGVTKIFITLAHGYDVAFKLKSLIPASDVISAISKSGSAINYGVSSSTNVFNGFTQFNRQIDVKSQRMSATYGSNIDDGISNWSGSGGSAWDGSKWVIPTGGTIYRNISVTENAVYLITLTVSNAYTPSENPAPQKIVFGTTEFEFFGANDANWDVALKAPSTGSLQITIGNTNWSGNISDITIVPLSIKAAPAEYINNKTVYLYSKNLAFGNGHSEMLNGDENTAIGVNAQGLIDTGDGNTAVGVMAQYEINNGSHNTAIGHSAQQKIHTGMYNHAFGYASQQNIDDGCWNIAMGNESQRDITSGCNNVGLGRRAQNSITTGSRNIAIGALAGFARGEGESTSLYETITANDQVLIGYQATADDDDAQYDNIIAIGSRATSKNNGVAVGARARAIGANSVAVGYMASATENNAVVLGNSSVEILIVGNKRIVFNNDGTVTWESI